MDSRKNKHKFRIVGKIKTTLKDLNGKVVEEKRYRNLTPICGLREIARKLVDSVDQHALHITHGAIGTGTAEPTFLDTILGVEVSRKEPQTKSYDDWKTFFTFFWGAPEISGHFYEFGVFLDGSATPNSGFLFSRVLIDVEKGTDKTLTVEAAFDII